MGMNCRIMWKTRECIAKTQPSQISVVVLRVFLRSLRSIPSDGWFKSLGIQTQAASSATNETTTEKNQRPCHPPTDKVNGAIRKLSAVPIGIKPDQKPVCFALVVSWVNREIAVGPAIIIMINPIPSSARPNTRPL